MAQIANLYDRYDMGTNVREELDDIAYRIDPEETPVVSSIGTSTAENTFVEWLTDSLAAANKDNALIEGDQVSAASLSPRVRLGNYTQIFTKTISLSDTTAALKAAGTKGRAEMQHQIAKGMAEIKRDIEASFTQNNAAVAGNSSTARKSAGLETMIVTNISSGGGGSTPAWSSGAPLTAPTDGTQRAFTETLLKTVLATGYSNGMKPKMLCLGALQKQVFSGFTGIAQNRRDVIGKTQAMIIGAADVYVSDYGNISVVPDLFMRNRTALLIDPEFLERVVLRPMSKKELPAFGDFSAFLLRTEVCLKVKNEKAHAKIADLT